MRTAIINILIAALLILLWFVAAQIISTHYYHTKTKDLIKSQNKLIELRAEDMANSFERNLSFMNGVPEFFKHAVRVNHALSLFGPDVKPSHLSPARRKKLWTANPVLKDLDQTLDVAKKSFNVNLISVINAAGDVIAASNWNMLNSAVGTNISDRHYLKLYDDELPIDQYAVGKSTHIAGLYFSSVVKKHGRILGAVVAKANVPGLSFLVRQTESFVVDRNGVVILSNDPEKEMHAMQGSPINRMSATEKQKIYQRKNFPELKIKPWNKSYTSDLVLVGENSVPRLLASQSLSDIGLTVYVEGPMPQLLKLNNERSVFFSMLFGLGSMVVLSTFGVLLYFRSSSQSKERLRDSEARYRTLFEGVSDSIFLMREDRFIDCNPATLKMFGCSREEIVGAAPYQYSPKLQPDGRSSTEKAMEKISAAFRGETQNFEWRHQRQDGTPFDAEVSLNSVELAGVPHLLATVRDISERKQNEQELASSRQTLIERNESLRLINHLTQRLHGSSSLNQIMAETLAALQNMTRTPHVAIYLLEPEQELLILAASHGLGDQIQALGKKLNLEGSLSGLALKAGSLFLSREFSEDDRLEPAIKAALLAAGARTGIVIPMHYEDQPIGTINLIYFEQHEFSEVELETLKAFGNTVGLAIVNARNVQKLAYQAKHDSLTGLVNRVVLHEEFANYAKSHGAANIALILLDLNRFKEINDTLGHHVGDRLLIEVCKRLKEIFSDQQSMVCRLGGDEFAILLMGLIEVKSAVNIAEEVAVAFKHPFMVEGIAVQVGASIGVAFCPEHGNDSHALLRASDVAMYQAKSMGKEVVVYDRSFDSYSPERLALATELVDAVEQGQLVLHYQPKADVNTGKIVGFEALVRWQHPRLGLIYPNTFIHLAEMSEIIHSFTKTVMDLAVAGKAQLNGLGYHQPVAINLSALNLMDARCVSCLGELLSRHGLPHDEIEIELTETTLLRDPDSSAAQLQGIANMGISIAIDDFGTGYSSLSYLRRLPLNALKIDSSFVIGMHDNIQDAIIVRSTIALAHNLGLKVIAEGVESAAALELLREMGCDQIQGYHLAKPMPLPELQSWLQVH